MDKKILLSISIAFIITFGIFFIFVNYLFSEPFNVIRDDTFFSKKLEEEKKIIFLLGSSHLRTLNVTHIIDKISQISDSYTVYNLSYNNKSIKEVL